MQDCDTSSSTCWKRDGKASHGEMPLREVATAAPLHHLQPLIRALTEPTGLDSF
jgi:hypothetical protein